jgi:ABC-2 type transport system ATP-binding protein
MADIAIRIKNVSKTFRLPHEKNTSVKSSLINLLRTHKKGYEIQDALKNISFEVKSGEFFGIIGRNGSGKSTLLKLLAGIYTPSSGSINVNGKLTPFIELGVGFNPELTGRENVYLNGALLGFNRREMQAMYNAIVDFAELEKFMDQKLKNYSSGMQVRLAFSIAIRAQSDILLIDEVLAVGDAAFQQKCYDYFNELKQRGQTVVLVTHDMSAVRRFCEEALLLDAGKIVEIGEPEKIAKAYERINLRNAEKYLKDEDKGPQYHDRDGNRDAEIVKIETFNPATKKNSKNIFC